MALPTMPDGWRPTTFTNMAVDPGGLPSHTHFMRLWIYDPTGTAEFPNVNAVPADQKRWVLEPVTDGTSPCCP